VQQWKELLAFEGIQTGFTVSALKLNDHDSLDWQGHWRALIRQSFERFLLNTHDIGIKIETNDRNARKTYVIEMRLLQGFISLMFSLSANAVDFRFISNIQIKGLSISSLPM